MTPKRVVRTTRERSGRFGRPVVARTPRQFQTNPQPTDGKSPLPSTSHHPSERWLECLALIYVASTALESWRLPRFDSPAKVAGGLLCVVWLGAVLFYNRRPVFRRGNAAIVSLFSFWVSLTIFWSWDVASTMSSVFGMIGLTVSALAVADVLYESLLKPARALLIGAALLALPVFTPLATANVNGRISYWSLDANLLAYKLCLGVAAACYLVIRESNKSYQFLALAGLIFTSLAVVNTGSRTGLGAVAGTLLLTVLIGARKLSTFFLVLACSFASWRVFVWMFENGRIPIRVVRWLEDPTITDSRVFIIESYRYTQSVWNIKGVGLSSDRAYLLSTGMGDQNVHSGFWKIWIETGLIGLLLCALVIVSTVIAARVAPNRALLLLCLPTLVAYGYTLGGIYYNAVWVLIGLAIGKRRSASSESPISSRVGIQPERGVRVRHSTRA